jgi:hypothetical protein
MIINVFLFFFFWQAKSSQGKEFARKMKTHHRTGAGGIKKAEKSWKDTDIIRMGEDSDSEVISPSVVGERSMRHFRIVGRKVKEGEWVLADDETRKVAKRAVRSFFALSNSLHSVLYVPQSWINYIFHFRYRRWRE